MIGGKPNQAYFFYGYADDDLLYMDPHECQPYVPNFVENMNDSSYHTNTMWKLKFSQIDPSVALGFVCKHEEDFLDLIESLQSVSLFFTWLKILSNLYLMIECGE